MKRYRMDRTHRHTIPETFIKESIDRIVKRIEEKTAKHGGHGYESTHEIYGILAEEFNKELLKEVHDNNIEGFENELIDVAVSAIWGLASMRLLRARKVYTDA